MQRLEAPPASTAAADAGGEWVSMLPAPPIRCIRRGRLESQLTEAAKRRVVVVQAPAGAGKSVLLAQWARHCVSVPTAWLPVCHDDNEPSRFWSTLASLLLCEPGTSPIELSAGQAGEVPNSAPVLLERLAGASPRVLIVDNFQIISNRDILDWFAWFVSRTPAHLLVVVAGRGELDLPLHRLRIREELTEFDGTALQFSHDEAHALFDSTCSPPARRDEIDVLTGLTEGWALGLRVAASLARETGNARRGAQGLEHGSRILDAFFSNEVLSDLPSHWLPFLSRLSPLDHVDVEFCQDLTGVMDAARILETMANTGRFVIQLDRAGCSFRFHHLFRDFLRRRLDAEDPSTARSVQRTVASWFQRHGDISAAMHYYVAGKCFDEAFALASSALAEHVSAGPGFRLAGPVLPAGLPVEYLKLDNFRLFATAAELLYSGRSVEGAFWLRQLEASVASQACPLAWQGRISFLWAVHDSLRGDHDGVLRHCNDNWQLLTTHGESSPRHAVSTIQPWLAAIDACIAHNLVTLAARSHILQSRPDEARAVLATQLLDGSRPQRPSEFGALALLACSEGRLRDASALASEAMNGAALSNLVHCLASLDAHLARSIVTWERGDLAGAEREIEDALQIRHAAAIEPVYFGLEWQLIRLRLSQGRPVDALDLVTHLRSLVGRRGFPHVVHELAELESRCRIALGDLERARRLLSRRDHSSAIVALLELSCNRPERAIELLDVPEPNAAAGAELRRLVLLARAHAELGHDRKALAALRRAIDLGRPEGFVTRFVDSAPNVLSLLRQIAGRLPDSYVATILLHAEASTVSGASSSPAPAEQLSAREREVLNYLPSHRSQGDIARELYVSLNTVKSHVQAIYRKLGVQSRSQAVTLARDRKLLD